MNVDSSWVWIAVLLTYSLWSRFDAAQHGVGTGPALAFAILGAALFFGSVFLHEAAHAAAARISGIPVLGITLVFFGGFTSARSEEKGPGPAFLISAVGPATSLVLGALFWGLSRATGGMGGPVSEMLGSVGWVNLFMAGFNVLPGLPLDGGRMLQAAVWRITRNPDRGTRIASRVGMGVGLVVIGVGVFALSRDDIGIGLWLAIIGTFIFQGARASEVQISIRETLARATVADAMEPPPPAVPAEMTLSEALDRYLRGHEEEAFPVVEGGKVVGMLSFASAREVGMADPLRPVRDAVVPVEQVLTAHPDEPLDAVSARLDVGRSALVLRDGELVGAITGGGLLRWAAARR